MKKATAKKAANTKRATAPLNPVRVGNKVHIRTVTHYYTGKIERIEKGWLVLSGAAWLAWPGEEFKDIIATGKVSDVQPTKGTTAIGVASVVDVTDWPHDLLGA